MSEWTTLRVLEWTTGRFARADIESPRLEAQILLAHVLGCGRVALYTSFDKPLGDGELGRYREMIQRRLDGEPVAYLVGEKEFWSLPFAVDASVLIPRGDTETLIEVVLDGVADRAAPLRIADVGTGSGAIAVTLASELGVATVVATDVSAPACRIAAANAEHNGVGDRVDVREGDLLAPLAGARFDVLAANLPYVPAGDIDGLDAEVRREPRAALDGGPDGLAAIRRLVAGARDHLEPGARVVLEHGHDQSAAVRELLLTQGFTDVATRRDLGDRDRVTSGHSPAQG